MPKRTTAQQKRLSNSPYAKNKKTTIAAPVDPKPASGLDAIGQAEWKRIRYAYEKSGRLTELDQSILALYCASYSRWKRAEHSLMTDGDVILVDIRDTHGNVTHQKPIVNPMARVAEAAARATHRFGDALGLSPASRVKQGFEHSAEKRGQSLFELMKDRDEQEEDNEEAQRNS
jgi:P27 family predicted phage terminase small subunit